MFFTYAEKKGSIFTGWTMREVAFDCSRRYLYYSADVSEDKIVPCSGPPIIASLEEGSSPTTRSPASPTHSSGRSFSVTHYSPLPPPEPPHPPQAVVWRSKLKLEALSCSAHVCNYKVFDPYLKEVDFYQMELTGTARHLVKGEIPPPEPLLCPSAGLAGIPGRCSLDNEEFIRDPFFQRELYESLKSLFNGIRIDTETQAASEGRRAKERKERTITSPRGTGSTPVEKISVVLRFRTEYEFRRFHFVVKSVLGYDKLMVRPYRGFPPYDPRNSIVLAHIPLYKWHTFKHLRHAPIYSFVRGDLIGWDTQNKRTIVLQRGAFLSVSHDAATVLKEEGAPYCELRLQHVEHFFYNYNARDPYFAFISDPGHTDVIFVPQPPQVGKDAVARFSAREEVVRVHRIVCETCFCSLDIRRVIRITEVRLPTVLRFMEEYIAEFHHLRVDVLSPTTRSSVCDEDLPAVWSVAQQTSRIRSNSLGLLEPAIPLYENHTNNVLTKEQLRLLQLHLTGGSETGSNEIVGIPYAEAEQLTLESVQRRRARVAGTSVISADYSNDEEDGTGPSFEVPEYGMENSHYLSLTDFPSDPQLLPEADAEASESL